MSLTEQVGKTLKQKRVRRPAFALYRFYSLRVYGL